MSWICDKCHNEMSVVYIREDLSRVECNECGNKYYIDDDDEYLGEDVDEDDE